MNPDLPDPEEYATITLELFLINLKRMFEGLPANRREFVRDKLWEDIRPVWASLFHDERPPPKTAKKVTFTMLGGALDLVHEHLTEKPELPPEYRAENFEDQFGKSPNQ